MEDKNREKINVKNLNRCIKEYRKLGHLLNILAIIVIAVLALYIINKLHILSFILDILKLLIPLFLGFIFAWLFTPLIDKLNKKMPRIVASILVYLIIIGLIIMVFALVIPNFILQIKDLVSALPDILDEVKELATKYLGTNNSLEENIFKMADTMIANFTSTLPDKLILGTKGVISVIINIALGLMISFYLSFDYHKAVNGMYKIIPEKYREGTKDLITRINDALMKYIQGVFIVMLLVFVSQSIGLSLAGLRAPLIFAMFCALTDIIPYFGPWIGAIPALIVALTMSPLTAIFTGLSIIIVQVLENNFYQPLIMGHNMKLHPVTIMLGLLIFGHFFGVVGMIIATPVIATIKIILMFVDEKLHIVEKIGEFITQNN